MTRRIITLPTLLLLAVTATEAQRAALFTTDGSRTYSLTETAVTGEKSDNTRSAIILKPAEQYQTIDGFGFAITYSSCYNLLKMTDEARIAWPTFARPAPCRRMG